MAGIIYDLVDILTQQKECYEGLNTLAVYKTEAVTNKSLELIMQIVDKEEEFIGRLTLLEKKRESILKDISLVTGIPFGTITVASIVEKIGKNQEVATTLNSLKDELRDLMNQLKKQNELNRSILEQSLEFVDFSVNALQSVHQTGLTPNYGRPGEEIDIERTSVFDTKQ